jgi:S-adenosylmethionine/arginine decarboxylase-like enzyme
MIKKSKIKNQKLKIHGKELILDLFGSDFEIITSKKKILEYVSKICKIIKIKPFGKTQIERFGEKSRWGKGYSFFQFIEESSISGHFIEGENIAYINIFSCKPFNDKIAKDFTKRFFKAKKVKNRFLIR